jgi:hypothetical protein
MVRAGLLILAGRVWQQLFWTFLIPGFAVQTLKSLISQGLQVQTLKPFYLSGFASTNPEALGREKNEHFSERTESARLIPL